MNANELKEQAGDKAQQLQETAQQTAEDVKERAQGVARKATARARQAAAAADLYVRDYTYTSIALVAVTAFALGLLVGRRL